MFTGGQFGKTLPVIHRHPDAVVILWNPNDHDHVSFVTIAQLLPCLQDMKADHWSMIVFWNEVKGSAARRGPDVGLDFTDQPAGTGTIGVAGAGHGIGGLRT